MSVLRSDQQQQLLAELEGLPEEYYPFLLQMIRRCRESVHLQPAADSFRRGARAEPAWTSGCWQMGKRANGNFLIAGRSKGILEVARDKKVVFQYKPEGETYPCQRLPNGNTVVAYTGSIFEVTRERKVVWSRDDAVLKGLMGFQLLDVPGDAIKGEVLR